MPKHRTKRFCVDLDLPYEDRWQVVIVNSWAKRKALKLARQAEKAMGLGTTAKWFAALAIENLAAVKEDYAEETDSWACSVFAEDPDLIWCANMAYELCSLCSSVAFKIPEHGMVHARNLDWDLPGMGDATILVDFINAPAGDFTAVTVPGYIGVLSGIAKGRFSATVNMNIDPPRSLWMEPGAILNWSAGWAMRYMFETCDSYEQALRFLRNLEAIRPFLVQIVGARPGEAAVVEVFGQDANNIIKYKGKPLGVTNLCLTEDYDLNEEEDEELGSPLYRKECIEDAARKCRSSSLTQIRQTVLGKFPVLNADTQQSMVMVPKSGEIFLASVSA